MAIRLADTARPNNYVDAEHQGTFPVAYAEDIWFADGTRLSEKTFDGQSIQKDELPLASADELGNIYQYIGETGTYKNGYFYKCIFNSSVYSWSEIKMVENPVVYSETVPDINAYETGSIVCYTGEGSGSFEKGHLYKKSETSFIYYYWTFYRDSAKTQPYIFYTREETLANGVNVYKADTTTGKGDISLVGSITNYQEFSFFVTGSSSTQYFHPEADTSKDRNVAEGSWIDIGGGSKLDNVFLVKDSEGAATLAVSQRTFTGTQAEWDALTNDEKAMYAIVNITNDTDIGGKFVDITAQCNVVLGTAKVMKCGQIVVIYGYVSKVSGSNGFREIATGVPVPISNGTNNSAIGTALNTTIQGVRITDSMLRVYCSTASETNYSIIYLTDE